MLDNDSTANFALSINNLLRFQLKQMDGAMLFCTWLLDAGTAVLSGLTAGHNHWPQALMLQVQKGNSHVQSWLFDAGS